MAEERNGADASARALVRLTWEVCVLQLSSRCVFLLGCHVSPGCRYWFGRYKLLAVVAEPRGQGQFHGLLLGSGVIYHFAA